MIYIYSVFFSLFFSQLFFSFLSFFAWSVFKVAFAVLSTAFMVGRDLLPVWRFFEPFHRFRLCLFLSLLFTMTSRKGARRTLLCVRLSRILRQHFLPTVGGVVQR